MMKAATTMTLMLTTKLRHYWLFIISDGDDKVAQLIY